jgi:hypothetical protein
MCVLQTSSPYVTNLADLTSLKKKRPTLIDKINAEKVQNKTSKDKVGKRSALHY